MSIFDGTPVPVTYDEVLCEIAKRVAWQSDEQLATAIKAIRVEHGTYVVPEAETRALEIERLRALAAEQDATAKEQSELAELAELRAKLGLNPDGSPAGSTSTPAPPEPSTVPAPTP